MKPKVSVKRLPIDEISNLAGFIETAVRYFPNHKWMFRGQGRISDPLLPKAGRPEYLLPNAKHPKANDLTRFDRWCHQAVAFTEELPANDFERLGYAQHFGLATRLLDWTTNAVTALYFATEVHPSGDDGAVFICRQPKQIEPERHKLASIRDVMLYVPRPVTRRIIAQDGVFTFHPKPHTPLKAEPFKLKKGGKEPVHDLVTLRIPADRKRRLQEELRVIGVLARSIYPDIEGLSRSINCVTRWMVNPR